MFPFLAPAALKLFFGGALKSVGGIFARLFAWLGTLTVWQLGCIALALIGAVQHFMLVGERHHSAKVAAHDAASVKLLNAALADQANLKRELATQNAAVDALAAKSTAEQTMAAEAQKRAAQRVQEAQASSGRLAASARHSPPPGAPCAPSKALQEQWQ